MKYPKSLLKHDRKVLDENKIKSFHFLYMRNKPGYGWKIEERLPDFNTIKLDQSFNWCLFSIPEWTRFNNDKEYLRNYAIIGIKVDSIRFTKKYNSNFDNFTWTPQHVPTDNNYSHCELKVIKNDLTKAQIRELRMTLKHKSEIFFKPNENCNIFKKIYHYLYFIYYK